MEPFSSANVSFNSSEQRKTKKNIFETKHFFFLTGITEAVYTQSLTHVALMQLTESVPLCLILLFDVLQFQLVLIPQGGLLGNLKLGRVEVRQAQVQGFQFTALLGLQGRRQQ